MTVTGATLSFANTRIGATSTDSPKTATVTNLGNEALAFRANPGYTADFSENSSDTNLCTSTTSLDPGELCDVSVSFTPQSSGSRDTNVTVTDNHLNGTNVTQNVAVSGTGLSRITPTITWATPSPITYGTTLSGVLNATATDGSSSVDGTFAYTATPQGGTASAVNAATVRDAGVYTLAVSFTPSSASYASGRGSVSLTVSDLTLSIASGGSTTATVLAGGHATYNLTIAPSTGSTFPDARFTLGKRRADRFNDHGQSSDHCRWGRVDRCDSDCPSSRPCCGANVPCLGTRSLGSTDGNARTAVRNRTQATVHEASAPRRIAVDRSHFDGSGPGVRRWYSHHFHDDDDHTANELHHNGNGNFRQRVAFNQPHPYRAVRVSMMWQVRITSSISHLAKRADSASRF